MKVETFQKGGYLGPPWDAVVAREPRLPESGNVIASEVIPDHERWRGKWERRLPRGVAMPAWLETALCYRADVGDGVSVTGCIAADSGKAADGAASQIQEMLAAGAGRKGESSPTIPDSRGAPGPVEEDSSDDASDGERRSQAHARYKSAMVSMADRRRRRARRRISEPPVVRVAV